MNWHAYPPALRSLINSEQPADRERALALCAEHGLDYEALRRAIVQEMVAEYDANEPARAARRRAAKETDGAPNARQRGAQRAQEGL